MAKRYEYVYALNNKMKQSDLNFTVEDMDTRTFFYTPWPSDISNDLDFDFEIIIREKDFCTIRCCFIDDIPNSKRKRMLQVLNFLNNTLSFGKFLIDSDNDVMVEYTFLRYKNPIENAEKILFVFLLIARSLDLAMKKIMPVLLSD